MVTSNKQNTLTTLERGFDIVDLMIENDGVTIKYVSDRLDIAPSTAYKYLTTMCEQGYAVKEEGYYHVGFRFLTVGGYTKYRKEAYEISIEMVRRLADETGERLQFVVEECGRGIYLHTEVDDPRKYGKVIDNRKFGKRRYLHSSAAGKAVLSSLSDERVNEIIDRWGLPESTPNTITDQTELKNELHQIRATGVSFNDEESVKGLRAVGVPVSGPQGRVIGGLSISGPVQRLKGDRYQEKLPNLLLASANEIELTISHS